MEIGFFAAMEEEEEEEVGVEESTGDDVVECGIVG